jgi:hypothetical protein
MYSITLSAILRWSLRRLLTYFAAAAAHVLRCADSSRPPCLACVSRTMWRCIESTPCDRRGFPGPCPLLCSSVPGPRVRKVMLTHRSRRRRTSPEHRTGPAPYHILGQLVRGVHATSHPRAAIALAPPPRVVRCRSGYHNEDNKNASIRKNSLATIAYLWGCLCGNDDNLRTSGTSGLIATGVGNEQPGDEAERRDRVQHERCQSQ